MMACWFDQMYDSCEGTWGQPFEVTVALWVYAICAVLLIAMLGSGWVEEHFGDGTQSPRVAVRDGDGLEGRDVRRGPPYRPRPLDVAPPDVGRVPLDQLVDSQKERRDADAE